MKDVLVSCEALHSGQNPHDSQGALQRAPATGPWWQPPCSLSSKLRQYRHQSRGAGASDNLTFPTKSAQRETQAKHITVK